MNPMSLLKKNPKKQTYASLRYCVKKPASISVVNSAVVFPKH